MGRIYPLGSSEAASYPDKRWSTLRVRACLLGGTLQRDSTERDETVYVLTLAGWTRPMSSLEAVEAAIERAEDRRG